MQKYIFFITENSFQEMFGISHVRLQKYILEENIDDLIVKIDKEMNSK